MNTLAIAFAFLLAQAAPTPKHYSDRNDEFNDGYRQGFREGYRQGQSDARGEPAPPAAPPPIVLGPIQITRAVYGNDRRNCNATRWLARQANGRRTASVEVSNEICGDPAKGERKQLEVSYRCGQVEKSASQYEHRTLYLNCTTP